MTTERDVRSPAHPALPEVERRAHIPAGFLAGGLAAGVKASGRADVSLIVASNGPMAAAAVFTPNTFAAAPVRLSRANLVASSGWARAWASTSGCANAATGRAGDADQVRVGELVAGVLGIDESEVLHLSTGVIGTRLPLDKVAAGLGALVPELAATGNAPEAGAGAL